MSAWLRSALGVVVGFALANLVMIVVSSVNGWLYPDIVRAVDANDAAALAAAVERTPGSVGAFLVTLAAWALGSGAGGFAAARIARTGSLAPSLAVGALFLIGGVFNNLAFPPPAWFWIATPFALLAPAAVAGRLALRRAG
jgi:hypothetical protein